MTTVLEYMQYELDGFRFGGNPNDIATKYLVERAEFAEPDTENQDTPLPLEDGILFGRDYRRGRTITFTMNIITHDNTAVQALDDLSTVWDADAVRKSAGSTSVLRWNRHGRWSRVYGRPRKFAPITGNVDNGWIPVMCDFRAMDHLYYSDTEYSNTIAIVPPPSGGWVMPFTFPVTAGGIGVQQGEIIIGGSRPAWIVSIINGPITNPTVEATNNWKFTLYTTINKNEFVVVNPRPWSRYVRRNGTTSIRGAFSAESVRLTDMKLDPGPQEMILSGTDPTGTATLTTLWREARTSF